ncbi:suppressor of lurcher protein 1 isoform X2 [Cephus cinctus]|uniref:Suppressor of lurcher protein 1 isoform X2 n=1 Tax=Cephus cinctus TaxID=211228 RepID=A0AAJ7C7J4_CEPCN|nr:suppressor of lurcher protein 1 isoform X2 [Cephus cinctus]XP_015603833.1 suppressor of lurcher protein 1 isoform X2 [Cephus cinctus]XP_024944835.1 suppressor of lurcher protein 1 isoform X2 [Cephus cinctus]XP_024944836.1 suppressor of lurcher protein 1 isoform X2 [Cephus cinctus]
MIEIITAPLDTEVARRLRGAKKETELAKLLNYSATNLPALTMQRAVLLLCWLPLLNRCHAVNPGCSCVVYSSSYSPQGGTFTSPDFPKRYPPNIDCLLYTFTGQPDEIVALTFRQFNVRRVDADCSKSDFLKVFLHLENNGVSEYTPWSGLLCGTLADVPQVLYSSGRMLVLEFHTEGLPVNSTGFSGNFRFIDRRMFETDGQLIPGTMCDHQFVSSQMTPLHGRFYSPRYPSSYPKNIRCSYRFRARLKERIRVVFEEISLQEGDLSCLNRADIIRVHDGTSSAAPTIAVLCNQGAEVEILSTGADLYVEFVANSEWPGQGFKAMFQFQPLDDAHHPDLDKVAFGAVTGNPRYSVIGPAVSATTSSCDMIYNSDTTKTGIVTSPGYPNPYQARAHCRYDFQGRGKERVQVVFQDFNLYHQTDDPKECDGVDSLVAFVHIDGKMEKIDSFCGTTLPTPLMSNGPRLLLEFRGVTSSRYSKGFKATYSFTENFGITTGRQLPEYPCAFVFNSNETRNGTFASPNYPGFYPRDTECYYFFHGQPDERVHLHFNYFDVEGVLPCEAVSASDFVEFSNYMGKDRKYSRHCGQLKEFDVESDRKFFRVTFKSNDRLDGTGFNASYVFLDEEDNYTVKTPLSNATTWTASQILLLFAICLLLG